MKEFVDMVGKTCTSVIRTEYEILFGFSDKTVARLYHEQDCCESVRVEDVCGDLDDLIDTPILMAEEATSEKENPPEIEKVNVPAEERDDKSFTWTFYRLATAKGSVTIRFYGSSNGYYSERVSFRHSGEPE